MFVFLMCIKHRHADADEMDEADWQDLADAEAGADDGDAEASWRATMLSRPVARRTTTGTA